MAKAETVRKAAARLRAEHPEAEIHVLTEYGEEPEERWGGLRVWTVSEVENLESGIIDLVIINATW